MMPHPEAMDWWLAIRMDRLDWFDAMIARGFPVDERDAHGDTALQILLRDDRADALDWVQRLLVAGAKANYEGVGEAQPLYVAVEFGRPTGFLRALVDHGANIDLATRRHPMILHKATLNASSAVVAFLLEGGVDPNLLCEDPRSALFIALSNGTRAALHLIEAGADVHRVECGSPYLHLAARHADPAALHALLDRGADPAVLDHHGRSAFEVAIPENRELLRASQEERQLQHSAHPAIKAAHPRRI